MTQMVSSAIINDTGLSTNLWIHKGNVLHLHGERLCESGRGIWGWLWTGGARVERGWVVKSVRRWKHPSEVIRSWREEPKVTGNSLQSHQLYIWKTYFKNTKKKDNWSSGEILSIPPENWWFLTNREVWLSTWKTFFSPYYRGVSELLQNQWGGKWIRASQSNEPGAEGAKELEKQGSGAADGECWMGQMGKSLWTKSPPLPLLGHHPDLRTNSQGTDLFPLISCLAQQLLPWISVSASRLFLTVAFLSSFCVRREEAERPGAEWRIVRCLSEGWVLE